MANMIPISTVVVGSGGASTMQFSNIPQSYTDLLIKISARSTRTAFNQDDLSYTFNGNTATSYEYRQIRGSGSAVISTTPGPIGYNYAGQINSNTSTNSTFSNVDIYIPNYTSSNNKSSSVDGVQENNATEAYQTLVANIWSNTSPITSIQLLVSINSNSFTQYSSATLYGIRKY